MSREYQTRKFVNLILKACHNSTFMESSSVSGEEALVLPLTGQARHEGDTSRGELCGCVRTAHCSFEARTW